MFTNCKPDVPIKAQLDELLDHMVTVGRNRGGILAIVRSALHEVGGYYSVMFGEQGSDKQYARIYFRAKDVIRISEDEIPYIILS